MYITLIIACGLVGLFIVEFIDHSWCLDELHAKKRDEIAKIQSKIITTLLEQQRKKN